MRFELKNKEFYKKTLLLMAPVALQQMITIGISFADNVMVGGFGETQISAAAFSNQVSSLFSFICMGLGSGAVVMSSQFWGRRELEHMRTVAAMALRVTIVFCLAFELVSVLFPAFVLRIFTNLPDVIAVGTPYMRLLGVTFILTGLTSTATYLLRSVSRVKIPLVGSSIAFVLNIFFNWMFIFGKLGAPRMELLGAAVGTVIARVFETGFIFGYFIFKDDVFGFRVKHFLLPAGALRKQYVRYSIPVLISDTVLGVSLSLLAVIMGHIGSEISAANAMISSVTQVMTVLNAGMAGASAVVIGNTIGSGDIDRARRESNTYMLLAFLFGIVIIVPLLLLEGPYLGLYNIKPETVKIAHGMLICVCWMMPMQTIAYVTSKGILRGGGDTRFLLLADSSLVWLLSLPLGALAAFVWHMSPVWVFFILRLEYPLKGIVCFFRVLTNKWIKQIKATED